jgi:hypothetical protein
MLDASPVPSCGHSTGQPNSFCETDSSWGDVSSIFEFQELPHSSQNEFEWATLLGKGRRRKREIPRPADENAGLGMTPEGVRVEDFS